ncbi:hypothetical protein ACWX0P_27215 [Vibrio mediterranei]
MSNRSYEYHGIKGLRAISEHVHIAEATLIGRIYKQGMSVAQAVESPPIYQRYSYKGIDGMDNIAKAFGISRWTLKGRLAKGMSIEEAIETPIQKKIAQKEKPAKTTATKSPDKLSANWKLALGIGA